MAYYRWRGVNMFGEYQSGVMAVRSAQELDAWLLCRGVALISWRRTAWLWSLWSCFLPFRKDLFFAQLSCLLKAGIPVHQALDMVIAQRAAGASVYKELVQCAQAVREGASVSQACGMASALFGPLVIHLLQAGEASGALANSTYILSTYFAAAGLYLRRLRAAAVAPILTLGAFCVVLLSMILFVVPRFAQVCTSLNAELPRATAFLLRVHDWLVGGHVSIFVPFFLGALIGFWLFLRISFVKTTRDYVVLKLPGISLLVRSYYTYMLFESLATLTTGGVRMLPALFIVRDTMRQTMYKQLLNDVCIAVESGVSCADAFGMHGGHLIDEHMIAVISAGEQAGKHAQGMVHGAALARARLDQLLNAFVTGINPACVIILSLLVLALLFMVYVPLCTFADTAFAG